MKKNIRMLYVGGLSYGTTGYLKFLEFKNRIEKVEAIDTDTIKRRKGFISYLNHKGLLNNLKNELNDQLLKLDKQNKFDFIYFSKANWVKPTTLEFLKTLSPLLVHYTPDAAFYYNHTQEFEESVNLYDYLLTTKEWEFEQYLNLVDNKKKIILVYQGINLDFFKPITNSIKHENVLFVGRKEAHYKSIIEAVYKKFEISVYGNQWKKKDFLMWGGPPNYVKGGNLVGMEYVNKINSAKIGLGLLSKLFPETSTTRSFEIPACGTFLLAERTENHQYLFDENVEAAFFSSIDELQDKLKFYLHNDSLREKIAVRGRERCIKSNYGNDHLINKVIELI